MLEALKKAAFMAIQTYHEISFTHLCIHSVKKYLLSINHVPFTKPGIVCTHHGAHCICLWCNRACVFAFSNKFHTFNQIFQKVKNHRSMGKLAYSV